MEAHAGENNGISLKKRLMSFAFDKILRVSLSCMLLPVPHREYQHGLFCKSVLYSVLPHVKASDCRARLLLCTCSLSLKL